MSDTQMDLIREAQAEVLGLSPQGFRQFLIDQNYTSELELRVNPAMVCELMESEIWADYVSQAEIAYFESVDVQRRQANG